MAGRDTHGEAIGIRRPSIIVIKNDHTGREVWRYEGVVLSRTPTSVTLEAPFNRDDLDMGYAIFRRGDRFVERHHSDRWYSIYEIHDVDTGRLKGWYCNFSRPARITNSTISADDLALDLWVYPDGRMLVLDRAEFEALPISEQERAAVLAALDQLRAMPWAGE